MPIFGLGIFEVPVVYGHNCSIDEDCGFLSSLSDLFGANICKYLASLNYFFIFTFWTAWLPLKVRKNGEASTSLH